MTEAEWQAELERLARMVYIMEFSSWHAALIAHAKTRPAPTRLADLLGVQDGNLHMLWNTLRFFSSESSYTMGERTGGVLQGCPRDPPPTAEELAQYGRGGLRALCYCLGMEPEEWLNDGTTPPAQGLSREDRELMEKAADALGECRKWRQTDWSSEEVTPQPVIDAIAALRTRLGTKPSPPRD